MHQVKNHAKGKFKCFSYPQVIYEYQENPFSVVPRTHVLKHDQCLTMMIIMLKIMLMMMMIMMMMMMMIKMMMMMMMIIMLLMMMMIMLMMMMMMMMMMMIMIMNFVPANNFVVSSFKSPLGRPLVIHWVIQLHLVI